MYRRRAEGNLLLQAIIAATSGVLLTLALPPTLLWPAALALVPLFVLVADSAGFRRAFSLGFWFALGFFSLYLLWLPASLSQPGWLGPLFWLLYPPLLLILASFWGLATGLSRLVGGRGRSTLLLLPAAWVLTELLRSLGYFAFPWGTLGYLWLDTPVAQLADLIGVNGLSLLTVTAAALLAAPFVPAVNRPRRDRSLYAVAAAVLLVAGAWAAGAVNEPQLPEPDRSVLLVQPNLDPFGRLGTPDGDLLIQTTLTAEATANSAEAPDLIVWPEGSLIGLPVEGPAGTDVRSQIQATSPGTPFVVAGRGESEAGAHNRAWLLQDGQLNASYDKTVLVPFGETWPLMDRLEGPYRFAFGLLNMGLLQDTAPGSSRPALPVAAENPFSVGVYICYESVFPQVSADLVRDGASVLINITNDAWFARGNGARQHYDMGRMRAIETRRYVLRSGIDGITGIVNPRGESVSELPRNIADTLTGQFTVSSELTPYVRHGQLIWWLLPLWLVLGSAGRLVVHGVPD